MFVHHALVDYVVRLVLATRDPRSVGLADVAGWIAYGASPRASLGLIAAGRALALVRGRDYVLPQDLIDLTADVLSHRLVLSYDAVADGIEPGQVVGRLLQAVPLPQVAPRRQALVPGPPGDPGSGGPLTGVPGPGSGPLTGYPPPAGSPYATPPGLGGPGEGWERTA